MWVCECECVCVWRRHFARDGTVVVARNCDRCMCMMYPRQNETLGAERVAGRAAGAGVCGVCVGV